MEPYGVYCADHFLLAAGKGWVRQHVCAQARAEGRGVNRSARVGL